LQIRDFGVRETPLCHQEPNLDCRRRLCPRGHLPQAVESEPIAARDVTNPERGRSSMCRLFNCLPIWSPRKYLHTTWKTAT